MWADNNCGLLEYSMASIKGRGSTLSIWNRTSNPEENWIDVAVKHPAKQSLPFRSARPGTVRLGPARPGTSSHPTSVPSKRKDETPEKTRRAAPALLVTADLPPLCAAGLIHLVRWRVMHEYRTYGMDIPEPCLQIGNSCITLNISRI